MKKILFTIVLLLACTIQISAQSFNEEQLEGTWVSNNDGIEYDNYLGHIAEIRFGTFMDIDEYDADYRSGSIIYRWTEKRKEAYNRTHKKMLIDDTESHILDYFIIGNDRLHIIVGDKFSLHFKIVELSDNTMKLQTKKGIMTFTKITTSVQGLRVNTEIAEKARYNINGQRLTRPEKGINIVQMSDNSARKEVVK